MRQRRISRSGGYSTDRRQKATCHGGFFISDFGINRDIGPIHATFTVKLELITDG